MEPKNIVILADGSFPQTAYPLSILNKADIIICCDGAILKLLEHTNLMADYIVGDMDTLDEENKLKFKDIIIHNPDQQTNDQTKAFRFALTLSPSRISILGATGGREDHTLGNISLLTEYSKEIEYLPFPPEINIITDYGVFTSYSDTCTVDSIPGEQISIFAFDATLKIKSAGLRYPTDNVIFDSWWKATLNESLSDKFTLTLSHPARILVYRCFQIKQGTYLS
ncbi:MAG: thiamine diphosphokinase [Bacteroidales bacterium]|nr:thiamine diphosphokinase [Bacteroidales bacterium]